MSGELLLFGAALPMLLLALTVAVRPEGEHPKA